MRTDENSLTSNSSTSHVLLMDRMQFFYELFPYPNRPFFLKPDPKGSLEAHAGHSQILAENYAVPAGSRIDDLQLRDVRHAFANNKKIALVGCGTDEPLLFRVLHPHNPIIAIDLSHKSLLRAQRKIQWHQLKPVELIHGEAEAVLKQEAGLDHIQCFGVLHHQPKPKKLLKAMAASLVANGTLRLMIYSSNGRRIERWLQRKFEFIWQSTLPSTDQAGRASTFNLKWTSFKLLCWRIFLPLFAKSGVKGRFRYIGFSRAKVADALLHPSDHPLRLRDVLTWSSKYGLKLVAHKAKSYDLGWLDSTAHPQNSIQTLVDEEERGNISSNIVLVFKKVDGA